MLQLFYSATVVEMTPVAQTNIEFYEIMHFLSKTTSFYKKNYPPFIKKNYRSPPYKKLQPLISAFIKNSIFGNNRDPWSTVKHSVITCMQVANMYYQSQNFSEPVSNRRPPPLSWPHPGHCLPTPLLRGMFALATFIMFEYMKDC